jgi:hypothetical protein
MSSYPMLTVMETAFEFDLELVTLTSPPYATLLASSPEIKIKRTFVDIKQIIITNKFHSHFPKFYPLFAVQLGTVYTREYDWFRY